MGSTPASRTSLRSQRSGERRLPRRSEAKAGQHHCADGELRLGKPEGRKMKFFYVYILQSEKARKPSTWASRKIAGLD